MLLDRFLTIERDGTLQAVAEQPEIVEAEDVVGVAVRVDDGLDEVDPFAQQLNAQLG